MLAILFLSANKKKQNIIIRLNEHVYTAPYLSWRTSNFKIFVFVFSDSLLSDVLNRHPDLLGQLALCLDTEQYEEQSPVIRLFEYLAVMQPQMTIQQLRNALLSIERLDIIRLLTAKGNNRSCF